MLAALGAAGCQSQMLAGYPGEVNQVRQDCRLHTLFAPTTRDTAGFWFTHCEGQQLRDIMSQGWRQ